VGTFSFCSVDFYPSWSSFPGGKVNPTDELVLHSALRETKEEVVMIDGDKIEILGRLGPPTQSLNGLRVGPYVVSFKCCVRPFRQVTSVKAFLHKKPYRSAPDVDNASPLPSGKCGKHFTPHELDDCLQSLISPHNPVRIPQRLT